MSNNKTVVPGMDAAINGPAPQNIGATITPQAGYVGTSFPGLNGISNASTDMHKPIMGFLYSVSRTGNGEYWPLYLGANTIGRTPTCAVKLYENTVSDVHAELVIRQMKNPDGTLVFIRDTGSTCGTLVNGSSLGFDPVECKSGDIITIGEHYDLYLIVVDAKALGLEPNAGFESTSSSVGGMVGGFSTPQPILGNNTVPVSSPFTGNTNGTVIIPPKQ